MSGPDQYTFDGLVRDGLLEIGDGYRAKNDELGGCGPIFLRAAYLQDSGFLLDGAERFIELNSRGFEPKVSRIDDVVITTKGNSTGRVGRIREREAGAVYSPHLSYWRSKNTKRLNPRFLYYWSKSAEFRAQLSGMAHGTDMAPYLSLRDQLRLRITLPECQIQDGIASVLGALDDQIELNRRMNETLEAMARAIFKDWFVDFGPTRAKQEGRAPYLAPSLWSLFPERFAQDGTPVGWRKSSIYEVSNVIYGAPFASSRFNSVGSGEPLIRIRDLPGENPGVWTIEVHAKGYKVKPGDIVVGMDGEFRAYLWGGMEAWLNQRLCVFAPKEGYSTAFVRNSILGPLAHVEETEIATTVIHLGKNDIDRFAVIIPCDDVLSSFNRLAQPLYQRIVSNKAEARTLAAARDLLLPRLMSGEIRVKGGLEAAHE